MQQVGEGTCCTWVEQVPSPTWCMWVEQATGRYTEEWKHMLCRHRNLLCKICVKTLLKHMSVRCFWDAMLHIWINIAMFYVRCDGWLLSRSLLPLVTGCKRESTCTCWRLQKPIIYLCWEEIHPRQTHGSSYRQMIVFCCEICSLHLTTATQVCWTDWWLCSGWWIMGMDISNWWHVLTKL